LNAKACSGTDILTCATEAASGCKIWQAATHCATNGLTCGSKAGAGAACQCPENGGTDVYVDPGAGSDVVGGLFPTGIQSPAACRYATLTNGLTKVGAPGRVIAISATLPATFGGETFPLNIPAGVSVMTADATFNASDYVIAFGGAAEAVILNNGTALRGFSINGSGTAAALIVCNAGSTILDTLLLNGNSTVADGVDLGGTCAATLMNAVTIGQLAGVGLNVSSSAATNLTGTTTISAAQIGVQLSNGSLTASGLHADGNRRYGMLVPGTATGAPLLNLNQSSASGNGSSGVFAGISLAKGSLTASNTTVAGNGGIGIELNTTATHQLTSVMAQGNGTISGASVGVALTAGTVVATGLTASSNTDSGVSVSGGTATLTGSTLDQNTGRGLILTGAGSAVTVSGGELSKNGQSGISAGGGTLNVGGGTILAGNGSSGISLTGATAVVTSVNVHDNFQHGVLVNSGNSAPINIGPGATLDHNGGDGILVDTSPLTAGGANSLTVDTVTISNSAKFGIYLQGDTGDVAATVKGSTITGNGDVGLLVEEGATATTSEAIQNNDVNGNNTGNGHQVGGVLFNTSSTLTSFIGNKVHSNTGDELGFNALPNGGGTEWVINPPSSACDTTSNALYCYGNGNVGLHILGGGATVNAQHVRWTNNPPTSGIDYSGAVTVTNPCAVITTCP
jgi:filamentous hemagglutinin